MNNQNQPDQSDTSMQAEISSTPPQEKSQITSQSEQISEKAQIAPSAQETAKNLLIQMAVKTQTIQVKRNEKEQRLLEITPIEILEQQQKIKNEYDFLIEQLQAELDQISIEIRNLILAMEDKVKVEGVGQAIYVKPSAKWDNGKLEGLMIAFPQLEQARTYGQPSVRITFEK